MSDDEKNNFVKSVMVVLDSSPASEAASEYALRMARQLQCPVVAAYVIDTATMDYLLSMHVLVASERMDFEDSLGAKGQRYLQRFSEAARKIGVQSETVVLRGALHKAVLRQARLSNCGMIVIGADLKSFGSRDATTEERNLMMALAECPVLVVKSSSSRK